MRWLLLAAGGLLPLLTAPGAATGCTNIYGIPAECTMHTYVCSVPGVGTSSGPARRQVVSVAPKSGPQVFRAYRMAPNGKANVIHRKAGIEIHYSGRRRVLDLLLSGEHPREFTWHPDCRRVAFWAPIRQDANHKRVALLDVNRPSGSAHPFDVIYDPKTAWPGETHVPQRMKWSPGGDALYTLDLVFQGAEVWTSIVRIDASDGWRAREVVRRRGEIGFFIIQGSPCAPVQITPPKEPRILYGTPTGLVLTDLLGKELRSWPIPSRAIQNLEWSPAGDRLAAFFRYPSLGPGGKKYEGLWLFDLAAAPRENGAPQGEQLYPGKDLHTLWFSPKGTYITWSSQRELTFRSLDPSASKAVRIGAPKGLIEDQDLELKGCAWHASERWLAYTARSSLYVYEVDSGTSRHVLDLATNQDPTFAAELCWLKDRVFLTLYEDTSLEARRLRGRPVIPKLPVRKGGVGPDDR